ncbi:hypothetical protein F5B20DRAFT_544972 [Whalleya microplaca]|nr:hypothetical protein F5B20DRAFT_544972 [Whalleya microplaca]
MLVARGQQRSQPCVILLLYPHIFLLPLSPVMLEGLSAQPAAVSLPLGEEEISRGSIGGMPPDPVIHLPFPTPKPITQPLCWPPSWTVLLPGSDARGRGMAIKRW